MFRSPRFACGWSVCYVSDVRPGPYGHARGAAPTGTSDEIGDRLIQSVTGYDALPEGGVFGESSGPFTGAELAEFVGIEAADLPAGSAYARIFATPDGSGYAMAMGFDFGDPSGFLTGFRDATARRGRSFQLFPTDRAPLGDTIAYEVPSPGTDAPLAVTAFSSGPLVIVLVALDPDDSVAVLQGMTRDQVQITPPTAEIAPPTAGTTPATAETTNTPAPAETTSTDDSRSVAYRLGQVLGYLFVVGLLGGLPVWLLLRKPRRKRRDAHSTVESGLPAIEYESAVFTPPPTPEKPTSPPGS